MENCRARRISAAVACDMPCSASAPAIAYKIILVRMWLLPAVVDLCGRLDLGNAAVPVEDLLAVPVQHALVLVHVVVDLLEIFDSVRLPADVGVDRQRAELRALRALGIEPVELINATLEQIVALVMLNQHHRNIVELDGVG